MLNAGAQEAEIARLHFGVLDQVPVGVLVLKSDFTVVFWNSCIEEWTDIPRLRIVGSDIRAYFPHLSEKKYASRLHDIFIGGPPTVFSSQIHNHMIPVRLWNGTCQIQHTVVTPTPSFDGSSYYALISIQDVTDLTRRIVDYRAMRDQALTEVKEREKVAAELRKTQEGLEQRIAARTADLVAANARLMTEVAERKKVEEELKQMVTTLNTLIDNFPEGVVLLDQDARVVHYNSRGLRYLETIAPSDTDTLFEELRCLCSRDRCSQDHVLFRKEVAVNAPPPFLFSLAGTPIQQASSCRGVVLVIKDVTEERELQERVQIQERLAAVGQLAAGIAHDFNNILTSIIGFTEIMISEGSLAYADRQIMEAILQNGLRAAHLVKQILDFSRKSISEMKPLELTSFLKECIDFIRRTIPENIAISMVCAPGDYTVLADPTKMQQILTNLAVNARDAMPNGGRLTLSLASVHVSHHAKPPVPDMPEGDWVSLSVADTGFGMPEHVLAHIYEPFFTTKETGKGTGLGLSQVYGIVKQHCGFIDVKSSPDKGTAFTLFFPSSLLVAERQRTLERFTRPVGDAETILVVEDNEPVRNLIRRLLERMNFRVLTAENGRQAIETFLLRQDEIKAIVTDLVMPEMGGAELAEAIRKSSSPIPVIALSGYPLGRETDDLKACGITECLLKPFEGQTLIRVVCTALGKKPL